MTTKSTPRRIASTATVGLVLVAGAGVGALAATAYHSNTEQPVSDQVAGSGTNPASTPDPNRLGGPLSVLRGHDDEDDDDDEHGTAPQNDNYLAPAPQQTQAPSNPGQQPHSKSSQS